MSAQSTNKTEAEFDAYAEEYSAGMEVPLKALLGDSADDFIDVKVDWLARRFPNLPHAGSAKLLDYGCGAGALLRVLRTRGWKTTLFGSDVSESMIETARTHWPAQAGPLPNMELQQGPSTPYPSETFDFVVISAVLHHVPISDRDSVIKEIYRVLRPGGYVIVFEHNPKNPITRYVVAHTPIDQNAVLLDERETRNRLVTCGFEEADTSYIMFTPPRMRWLRRVDAILQWLPLGAQYATLAKRSNG